MCGLCETLQPSSEMVDIYIRDSHGLPVPVRFCKHCANPQVTYIASHMKIASVQVPSIIGFALGITIALLNVALGGLAGGQLGLFVALAGILTGTGISAVFALTCVNVKGG